MRLYITDWPRADYWLSWAAGRCNLGSVEGVGVDTFGTKEEICLWQPDLKKNAQRKVAVRKGSGLSWGEEAVEV